LDAGNIAWRKDRLARAKAEANSGNHGAAFALLRDVIIADDSFVDQSRVARCLAAIDLVALGLRPLRLALVAGSTMDHFAAVLRYWLARAGFAAELLITPFDTTMVSVLDPESPLYRFEPDIVWLFGTHRDVDLAVSPGTEGEALRDAVKRAVEARRTLWIALRERLSCLVIDNNADIPGEDAFGNLAGAAAWGSRTLLRRYNAELAAVAPSGIAIFDLDHVASLYGKRRWSDPRYWFHSRHAFALDASGLVAYRAARLIAATRGLAKKCLVLDLDNTLWGGTVGDDGVAGIALGAGTDGEAFVAFQCFIKALKDRGAILAACSKNDSAIAAAVFRDHPDCVLRLDDFAAFIANWDNKADNLRDIAAQLNIGLDAIVFVDDNPVERDIVRTHLPQVEVVELPDDPALFVSALAECGWFETTAFSTEDRERGRYYAENARRETARQVSVDMASYLASLDMIGSIGDADPIHLPRIAQLINKSNQFHLTGTRYGEAEITALAECSECFVRHVRLRDRFGDNGLIACLVLRREERALHIDTWVMSCRVLGRSVEEFIANEIRAIALAEGCNRLVGRYVRSARNGLVAGLYTRLGFALDSEAGGVSIWLFDIDPAAPGWTTYVGAVELIGEPAYA
jgi:FkbH-like protein